MKTIALLLTALSCHGAACTAYTATGSVCADGHYPVAGKTCAGPRWVPLGTRVYIAGVGWRTVTDRLNKRHAKSNRYDIFMASEQQARRFGKQQLKVTR